MAPSLRVESLSTTANLFVDGPGLEGGQEGPGAGHQVVGTASALAVEVVQVLHQPLGRQPVQRLKVRKPEAIRRFRRLLDLVHTAKDTELHTIILKKN